MRMKQIILDNQPTQYWLCEDGIVYNTDTHLNLTGTNKKGYIYFQFTVNGKTYNISQHKLLAEYYIPNPNNYPIVHHKDHNPLNNKLENLEWATVQENNIQVTDLKDVKTFEKPITEEEIQNERWVQYLNTQYYVSSLGRIKNIKTNKISMGSINKNSRYVVFTLTINGKQMAKQAHRVIYEAFHPKEQINIIDHIDACKTNNRIENLRNITQKDNVQAAVKKGIFGTSYLIGYYNEEGKLIQVYQSVNEASKNFPFYGNRRKCSQLIDTNELFEGIYIKKIDRETYLNFVESHECEVPL